MTEPSPGVGGGVGERTAGAAVHVLHVDDDPSLLDVASRRLEQEAPAFEVTTAASAEEGLDLLAGTDVDCVVSDYEMPGTDGLAFLRAVREDHPDLPFVLFTGRGSEGVASEAISAGVTDYVRKHATDAYATLANRVRNAVDRYRTGAVLERLRQRHELVAEASADAFAEWDLDAERVRWSDGFGPAFGYDEAEVDAGFDWWERRIHPDDRAAVRESIERAVRDDEELAVRNRFRRADGTYAHVVFRGSVVAEEGCRGRIVGALVDVTDRVERERKLTALHEASQELLRAETESAVADAVVDAATEVLDLPAVVVRLFDPDAGVLRPAAVSEDASDILGERPPFDPGEGLAWEAYAAGERAVYDDVREAEAAFGRETPLRSAMALPLGEHGVLGAAATEPAAFDDATAELAAILAAGGEAALDRIERTSDLAERDRQLRRKEQRLDGLLRFDEAARDVQSYLAEADDREAVERRLCRRLASLDPVSFAWVGSADEQPAVRASAGDGAGYLDAVFGPDGAADADREPAARCGAAGEPVVVDNVADAVQGSDWRRAALEAGFGAAVSVPLVHADRRYGVLTVYADETGAFDDLVSTALVDLGRTVAHGVDALETRRSLQADTTVELELTVAAPSDPMQALARRTGSTVALRGSAPSTDGSLRLFVTTETATTAAVRDAVADAAADLLDVVGGDRGDELYELAVESTLLDPVHERGAAPVEAVADPDQVRVVAALPGTVDVRSFVETLESTYGDVDLLARRDDERLLGDPRSLSARVLGDLTDRQREVLGAAYYSGYFEWPRRRSGEEVAEALDIAQPTFHRHLRACQRTVLAALLDDRSERAERTRKP